AFSRLLHCRVTITDGKVNHPVRRNWAHLGSDLIHAGNAVAAVFEDRVLHWAGHVFPAPTKQRRIEVSGLLSIVSAEFVPTQCPYVSIDACAGVSFGLPDSENGTGRILD